MFTNKIVNHVKRNKWKYIIGGACLVVSGVIGVFVFRDKKSDDVSLGMQFNNLVSLGVRFDNLTDEDVVALDRIVRDVAAKHGVDFKIEDTGTF